MTEPITINVFSYPENSKRCEKTIGHIRELVKILNEEYNIDLNVEVKDSHKVNTSFSKFTIDFFDSRKKNKKYIHTPNLYRKCIERKQITDAIFFAVEDIDIKDRPFGQNLGKYPLCVAVETTGKKESIYHEFLHQLGVSEGYDKETKRIKKYCSTNCWMQLNATNGKELCKYHQEELKRFLQKHNNKTKKR